MSQTLEIINNHGVEIINLLLNQSINQTGNWKYTVMDIWEQLHTHATLLKSG